MPIRVVARIRPVLETDLDSEVIVHPVVDDAGVAKAVKVPSLRDDAEELTFAMDGVYGQEVSQEDLFNSEAHADAKHLFQGKDITYLAYGSSGTGKTHTMRGGLKLEDRGLIPRLMSNIYRRAKKVTKDAKDHAFIKIYLSYFEIYRDEIYDLLEPLEDRTGRGLSIHESGKSTRVLGLSEVECPSLKESSRVYIEANKNRVVASTKLNTSSSRSHAILRVKIIQSLAGQDRISTATAVDLAGSEDSRKTGTSKEGLAEAAAINKSLFTLSQCIDAMSRGDKWIPARENKLTRVLGLGTKPKAHTTMIVTLSPGRFNHTETLSALNVISRAKRIEAREIENEIVFKQAPRQNSGLGLGGADAKRGLRPLGERKIAKATIESDDSAPVPITTTALMAPVRLFTVFKDGRKTPTVVKSTAALTNITNTTPMVYHRNRSPGKKCVFVAMSPSKKARKPLQARPMPTPMRIDEEDMCAPHDDEYRKGMRYLQQMREGRAVRTQAASGTKRAEKLRVWPDGEVVRVSTEESAALSLMDSPMNGLSALLGGMNIAAEATRAPLRRRAFVQPGGSPVKLRVWQETPTRVKVWPMGSPAKVKVRQPVFISPNKGKTRQPAGSPVKSKVIRQPFVTPTKGKIRQSVFGALPAGRMRGTFGKFNSDLRS